MPASNHAFVRKLEKLVTLSSADREILIKVGAGAQSAAPGTDLMNDPNGAAGAILLLEGFACRYRLRPTGERQITDFLLPGDFSMFETSDRKKLDAIRAMASSTIVRVPAEYVAELMVFPTIAGALSTAAKIEGATLREWLANMGRRSADERLAHLFCELSHRMQGIGEACDSFGLPLTQQDIGDIVGLSSVHVNRTLQSLRQRNLIKLQRKVLTILDSAGLKELAGFNPYYLGG